MSLPLKRLQEGQESARFSLSVIPPCFSLIIWSELPIPPRAMVILLRGEKRYQEYLLELPFA